MVDKVNPTFDAAQPRSFLTKSIMAFAVIVPDISGSTQPGGAIDTLIKTISLRATLIAHSAMGASNTFWVEGDFPDDDFNGDNITTSFAAQLQVDIRALGTVDGINFSGANVALAFPVFKA